MNLHTHIRQISEKQSNQSINAVLIGAGEFGASFIFQSKFVQGLNLRAIVNKPVQNGVQALLNAGFCEDEIQVCTSYGQAKQALDDRKYIVLSEFSILEGLGFDVLVEATGHPEAGAAYAEQAIQFGMHVVMVSKEVDSVVGPYLNHLAKEVGLVYTLVDGDQPSLLIGLVEWATVLGLDILTIGKSSEYDFIFDPATSTVTCNGETIEAPKIASLWEVNGRDISEVVAERAKVLSHFSRHAVPDLCEMAVVANHTSFKPSGNIFSAPIARPIEIPDILRLKTRGGILDESGVIDVINTFRKPDELSLAGGEFIIVACHDQATWQILKEKGHVVSEDGQCAMIMNPRHLLGVESATSVLSAAMLGIPTSSSNPQPKIDLIGRATEYLPAGTQLDAKGHHHNIDNVSAELHDAQPISDNNPAPYYLLANRRLVKDVSKGQIITIDAIAEQGDSVLWRLRQQQDNIFLNSPKKIIHTFPNPVYKSTQMSAPFTNNKDDL